MASSTPVDAIPAPEPAVVRAAHRIRDRHTTIRCGEILRFGQRQLNAELSPEVLHSGRALPVAIGRDALESGREPVDERA
jgi:hypothetical protein